MNISLSTRLSRVIFFSLLVCNNQAFAQMMGVGDELTVIPLRQLLPAFQDESALENLFAFDPNEDLAENPTEVEIFLDFNFQNHPSLVLPGQRGLTL
jgi:hypothetical protein